MKKLLQSIESLKASNISIKVKERITEFNNITSEDELFKELCFCIMTANYQAEKSIQIQANIDNGFITFTKDKLKKELRNNGYRFPNVRAEYIHEARKHRKILKNTINSLEERELREWIVKNVKGIGFKEASHFLRNIGFKNSAIIDFHIIDILADNKIIAKPKTITKNNYLEIETRLKQLAEKTSLNLAELDLYLWYLETGKILK
ncbi:MAG: N-glycosylase/DNA lyase [Candidatus Woesearchaeota archaeon]|jgi:N-glycosylase/DNA lyase|nr:N-glycosylase/DNA lyase [Candidatus Woesearchaeota archaeon]